MPPPRWWRRTRSAKLSRMKRASIALTPVAVAVAVALALALGLALAPGGSVPSRAADKPAAAPSAAPNAPAAPKSAAAVHTIVFCAPGYPGNTVQAQPAMDAFARAVEKTAGLSSGTLHAVYHETEGGGIEALHGPDAVLALTTLPFYLKNGDKAGLEARLTAVRNGSPAEYWTLIAKKGRVGAAIDMEDWELTGPAGYAPAFVRAMMQVWGPLRSTTKITFTPAPLGALRRVVDGENLAVLLEPEQVQALFPKHPFAKDLEIVANSKPVPGSVVSVVGERLDIATAAKLLDALTRLQGSPEGTEALKTLRIDRFVTMEPKAIAWVLQAIANEPNVKK